MPETEYRSKLEAAGFRDVDIESWRTYTIEDAREFVTANGLDTEGVAASLQG